MSPADEDLFAVRWLDPGEGGPAVEVLDQTLLPEQRRTVVCRDVATLAEAIRSLRVRGAPALGVAGAYGVALGALVDGDAKGAAAILSAQRPTAVNLGWGCWRVLAAGPEPATMLAAARRLDADNTAACEAMGRHGAALLGDHARVLTHCNTGTLACQGIGSAFGVVRTAFEAGNLKHLWVDETRPLLQGARLTAYEASVLDIPHSLIVDGAAGALFAAGRVDAVLVGADRIAANGDTANKVGTATLAVLAHHHDVAFYVVAPTSTIDPAAADGAAIDIEYRDAEEVRTAIGIAVLAPATTPVWNPAFDVTPAALITAIVTERGVVRPPFQTGLATAAAAG
jgi:methylthioribose-1-phosphate isomerase